MKGGTFLSKKGYDETKKKINEDYVFILTNNNSSLQKSYEKDTANEEEYELQYRAIICMLYFAEEIKTISVSSLVGFIFHVKSRNSYFKKLDIDGTTEIDVYDILLKCSIVTQETEPYNFEVFESETENKTVKKITDPILSIKNEANEQQSIYIKMLKTGFIIAPSVLDVSILKDKEQMETFFNILVHVLDKNEITQRHVENIIKKAEELNGSLSVMTCEYLNDSDTIYNLLYAATNQPLSREDIEESLLRIYAYILVTCLELYVYCGIIHDDLHLNNIMAKKDIFDKTQELKNRIYFIDYGYIVKIGDDFNTRFNRFFTWTDKGTYSLNWAEILFFTWENYLRTAMLFTKFYGWSSYDILAEEKYVNYTSDIFRNISFQKSLRIYFKKMFDEKYIHITGVTKVRTTKRWKAMKFHKKKYYYKEREQDIKEEKVLLNDFKDDVTTMIRGNVSIITKEQHIKNMQDDVARLEDQPIRKQEEMKGNPIATGGKSNLTRKRSKKHHKKTQRRRR